MRVVDLPATGRRVPVRAYCAAVRTAKANRSATFRHGLTTWWPVTGADVVAEFRAGMHDRINRHLPGFGRGRKWSPEWQRETWRAARAIEDRLQRRVVLRWVPAHLRGRFAHLLDQDGGAA